MRSELVLMRLNLIPKLKASEREREREREVKTCETVVLGSVHERSRLKDSKLYMESTR